MVAICSFTVGLSAQQSFTPAQYQTGEVPALPAMAVGGGQVFLEATVASDGRVADIKPLRTTAPFTEMLTEAVRGWRFRPAEDSESASRPDARPGPSAAIESKVLIAGVFRPPALNMPTLGEPPRDGAPASDDTAYPLRITMPPFPPQANRGGVVLLEARVDRSGAVSDVKILRSSAPFDEAARRAVNEWVFRPARLHGADTPSLIYVVLGFAPPVSNGVPAGTRQ
jgi:TonB family protein